ncbi:MAG: hypothetical protein ACRYFZ_16135 [Janthinobacterium lividum]
MDSFISRYLNGKQSLPTTEQERKRLVTGALNLTAGTSLAPKPYERMLLDQFVRGNLTIDQVLDFLERQEHE